MPETADLSLSLQFGGDDDDASRVAEFLALAQAVYVAAWRSDASTVDQLNAYVRSLTLREVDALFVADSAVSRLRVISVTHQSPLNARVAGASAGALVLLAMILSGGKFE